MVASMLVFDLNLKARLWYVFNSKQASNAMYVQSPQVMFRVFIGRLLAAAREQLQRQIFDSRMSNDFCSPACSLRSFVNFANSTDCYMTPFLF